MKQTLLAIVGAVIGGFVGYMVADWASAYGFYAMVLPGGLLGFGAGFGRSRSIVLAALCGIAATLLGFYADSQIWPFAIDKSLEFYVHHIHKLTPIPMIMIALGGFLGFWCPYRSADRVRSTRRASA